MDVWKADHMSLVNRPNRRVPDSRGGPADYVQLARRVAALG